MKLSDTESIRIGSPSILRDILKQLDEHVNKGELVILFQSGVTAEYFDDSIEGYYLNPQNGLIFRLTCETYHGSEDFLKKLKYTKKTLM